MSRCNSWDSLQDLGEKTYFIHNHRSSLIQNLEPDDVTAEPSHLHLFPAGGAIILWGQVRLYDVLCLHSSCVHPAHYHLLLIIDYKKHPSTTKVWLATAQWWAGPSSSWQTACGFVGFVNKRFHI